MAYSPYQTAGSQSTLYDLFQQSKFGKQKSDIALESQRGKMTEEFEKQLEDAQKAAKRDAKKNKGLFQGINLLASIFGGPLGIGLTKGITAGIQGDQQRQARKKLLSGVSGDRWKKTFLRDPMKSYKEEAEDLQMSSGDVLRGAVGSGLTGFMASKAFGGDEGSMFKQWRSGRQAAQGLGGIEEEALKNIGASGDSALLGEEMKKLLENKGLPSLDTLQSKTPGLSNLWQNLTKGDGLKGGMDELQSAMMLPMLLQMMIGGEY